VPLVAKGSRCVFCKLLPKSKRRKGEKWREEFSFFSTESLVPKYSKSTHSQQNLKYLTQMVESATNSF